MDKVTIRMVSKDDLQAILPLFFQLGYPTTLESLRLRYENFIKNESYEAALAERGNKVIGWVAWSKSFLFVADKLRFHIEGLIVDKDARGYGVGKKLMLFVEEYAKQFSPVIIDLTSGLRRSAEGTHEFYKKLGYLNEGHMAKLYLRKEL